MRAIDRFAVALGLATLAIAWPLLDLLGNNAEFFLSRRSPRIDVVVFALTIGIGLPLVIGLIGLLPRTWGRFIWLLAVALLGAVLARLGLRAAPLLDWARTTISIAIGVAVAWAAVRLAGVQMVARYLLAGPILVTALFFLVTPTGAIARSGGSVIGRTVSPAIPVPIVWVVLDEFPVASMMLEDGSLNRALYPNFARLSDDGTWFRNAVGIEQQTEQAVPAILTGARPGGDRPPYAGEYPNTAFTLLADTYNVTAIEAITALCPDNVCGVAAPRLPAGARARDIGRDTLIVSGHLFLPDAVSSRLPPIDSRWGGFGGGVAEEFSAVSEFRDQMEIDRRTPVAGFIEAIDLHDPHQKPFFGFVHLLIPHHPWQYLPTGQVYPLIAEKSPGTTRTGWSTDQWLLDQATQRHLLQAAYADYALGQIFSAMDDSGIYEDAIVVVMADHGIAIKPDVFHQRYITNETIGQVAAVPLFIKGPGITPGKIEDRRSETVDVLPTVAAMLAIEVPWSVDGLNLLGPIDREESTMSAPQGAVTFGVDGLEKFEVAADIARAFPTGDPFELRPPGAPDILQESVDSERLALAGFSWTLDRPQWYLAVDTYADSIPARITGVLNGAVGDEILAVVVNGRIEALTRAYVDDKGTVRFQSMVPPESLADGDNEIEVLLVSGSGTTLVVHN